MSQKPLVLLLGFLLIYPLSAGAQLAPPSIPQIPVQTGTGSTDSGDSGDSSDRSGHGDTSDSSNGVLDKFIGTIQNLRNSSPVVESAGVATTIPATNLTGVNIKGNLPEGNLPVTNEPVITGTSGVVTNIIDKIGNFIGITPRTNIPRTGSGGRTGNGTTSGPGITIPDKPGGEGGDIPTIPPYCGNGRWEPDLGEECDPSTGVPDCRSDCTKLPPPTPVCGDGKVDPGETCDDGNTLNGDTCSSDCKTDQGKVAQCGNGVIEGTEECDDGIKNGTSKVSVPNFVKRKSVVTASKILEKYATPE